MRRILLLFIFSTFVTISASAAYSFYQFRQLQPCLHLDNDTLESCLNELPRIERFLRIASSLKVSLLPSQALTLLDAAKPYLNFKDYFYGKGEPTTYLILLQNDTEMKTNGGFFGSYSVVTADNGVFSTRFQDIYVPDGQLPGHVDPPNPIQAAFKTGAFKLRDSDWDPDFPHSATAIRWFFTKGKEVNPDVLITLSLTDIKKIIEIVGDFSVPEYNTIVTADNVYSLLQNQAELNFFPGSTQKKDALTATGRALISRLQSLSVNQKLQIARQILDSLNNQNILVNSLNSELQQALVSSGWGGELTPSPCAKDNCLSDTFVLIQANMGANKSNCCTTSQTNHTIRQENQSIIHEVQLTFQNASPKENGDPPRFYGGNYISYLRFYIPKEAHDIKVFAEPTLPQTLLDYPTPYSTISGQLDQTERYGFKEIGFFHITKALTTSTVNLSYQLRFHPNQPYELHLLKQHGLHRSPQLINIFGDVYQTDLSSDASFIGANTSK